MIFALIILTHGRKRINLLRCMANWVGCLYVHGLKGAYETIKLYVLVVIGVVISIFGQIYITKDKFIIYYYYYKDYKINYIYIYL